MVPERTPEWFRPHQPIGIECVPLESGGRCPACRLVMHRRHDGANVRKVACVRCAVDFTRNHIGEQFAFHPSRQASPSSFPGRGDIDLGEILASLRQ